MVADVVFDEDLCSYPGVVHGGIVSTAADDVMAHAVLLGHHTLTFSTTLRTRFLSVVRAGAAYRITARTTSVLGGMFGVEAEVTGETGDLHALVTGTYKPIRDDNVRSLLALNDQEHRLIRPFLGGGGER
ncbi:PaaI family thioesterase [Streptomyces sp. NPDC002588]|uniref:PaaI family thioesterase n=1 Tax=Streptomyces sp. NPDC002588 TaxID=3154419 RepID=UPI00332BADC4